MTRLLLLRHGQSTWNAEGRWQGRADPPLSDEGRAQALAASDSLDHMAAIYSSDQARAWETADIIARERGWALPTRFIGLRERDVGEFTGLTRAEIEQRWPGLLARVPLEPPGAEPRSSLLSRAVATLHRIAQAWPEQRVLVVTHGALIRAVEAHLGVAQPGPPRNLTGRWLSAAAGQLSPGPTVSLLVATAQH